MSAPRAERLVAGLLLSVLAAFCALVVTVMVDESWRHVVDSAIYILCAQSMAAGDGYQYLGMDFFVRPPGLSFLLQPWATPPYDFVAMNRLVQVAAVLTFAGVALALRRVSGRLMGTLAALLFAVNILTVESFNNVLAEFPFMALFFTGAWLLLPDGEGRQVGWVRGLAGALLVGLSLYFRSVGLLLLPGLVLVDLFRRDGRRWQGAALAGVVVLVSLPWMVHSGRAAAVAPRPSTHLLMFDYATAMFHESPGDPDSPYVDLDGWIERITNNVEGITVVTSHALIGTQTEEDTRWSTAIEPIQIVVMSLVALAMLYTWLRRRSLLDWYMAVSMAVLLTYFTFVDRLLLPVMPMMLASIVYAVDHLGAGLARLTRQPRLRAGLLVIASVALLGVSALNMEDSWNLGRKRANWTRADLSTARWIEDNLPEDAVLLHEKGPIFTILTGRTCYSWRALPGVWPDSCPPVDIALFGPRPAREVSMPHEHAIGLQSKDTRSYPVEWFGGMNPLRIYQLSDIPIRLRPGS